MNIYQKLSAITAELQTVAKNLNVTTGKGQGYKAVSERDVIDAVKPLEAKHGVFSYPCNRVVLESQTLESESQYGKKTTFFTRIATTYRFVNVEDPQDFVETTVFSEGIDPQDKGSGKAMTYADKYALMKCYKISTGDDPDQTASDDTNYRSKSVKKTAVCECCGKPITPAKTRNGQEWSVEDIVGYSKASFGKALCNNCIKDANKKAWADADK